MISDRRTAAIKASQQPCQDLERTISFRFVGYFLLIMYPDDSTEMQMTSQIKDDDH